MNAYALALWGRALQSLHAARLLEKEEPDSSASRAYYAVFHAVSALFALKGTAFKKHSAVETAVFRDLVHAGIWDVSLGEDYAFLGRLRYTGDYGGEDHAGVKEAQDAIAAACRILAAFQKSTEGTFSGTF